MTIKDQDYGCVVTTSNTAWNTTAGSYYYDESSPNINDWQYKSLFFIGGQLLGHNDLYCQSFIFGELSS